MPNLKLNLDSGGIRPIIEAFENHSYNQNFEIQLIHSPNKRIDVSKYPLLCSIVNEIKRNGKKCIVNLNYSSECSQLSYAERMGFLSFLGLNYGNSKISRIGSGSFIKVRNVDEYYYPGMDLQSVFENDFGFTPDQSGDLATLISEIAINSYLHSLSKGGAIFCCHKYPTQKYLNLHIVDSGVGIYNAMRISEKYKIMNEREVFLKSFEFGEGNGKGYGQGLYLVSEFIRRNFGTLRIISGRYMHIIDKGTSTFYKTQTNYKGVIVNLGIPFEVNSFLQELMVEQTN